MAGGHLEEVGKAARAALASSGEGEGHPTRESRGRREETHGEDFLMTGCGLLGLRNWHAWLARNPQMEYKSEGRSMCRWGKLSKKHYAKWAGQTRILYAAIWTKG